MTDIIRLLPDSVANQIAAGEVVQRPAAAIKELVENAVDAGATIIKIIVKDAGRTLLQVIDNGCGMSPTDARLAFERHATSKISKAADLYDLHTMGFRGEALASICAIARVELRTMRKDDTIGTCVIIEGSKVESQEPEVCAPGCNFMVKNLFFNQPARRKFLKSDHVEMNHILREFERMALVNPDIEFQLVHNDVVLHQLLRSSFKQRIVDLFGKSIDKQLVPVDTETSIVKINGFVSRPENARKRGALQFLTVNGRNMRHPYFHKAIMHCFEQLIPSDEQPCYFINLTVDPETIDVNIHPQKSEIKFENEQPIWQILVAAVKEGLGKFNAVPSIDFDLDDAPEIPVFQPDAGASHGLDLDTSYNPFASQSPKAGGSASQVCRKSSVVMNQDWEKLYQDFERKRDEELSNIKASALNSMSLDEIGEEEIPDMDFSAGFDSAVPAVMQLKGRYILSPAKSGLTVVDQHRAHVRILYDRYLDLARLDALSTQRVIFPEVLELSPSQSVFLEGITGELSSLGFDISFLGDNSWTVNGLPSVLNDVNPRELMMVMLDMVMDSGEKLGESMRERIAFSMAKSAAIKPGQQLTSAEMDHILSDLFKLATPNYTPDGKLVLSVIATDDIARLFA
ncbi:MAG: DNA mismatch repair endonuclease MutL [Bacteroidales bacterium]|nr:MAG: DNA mismatch repair endonuclease MutL [Bacteroidales bacterium]